MKRDTCQIMEERLVDFADDALPSDQANQVREHIEQCPHCRETVAALNQSLTCAETIWQDNAHDVGRTQTTRSRRWRYVAAAGILLTVSIMIHRPVHRPPPTSTPTLAEIENHIAESGIAARLLAATAQLEAQTSLQDLVESQYRHISEKYSDTTAAEPAHLKLKSLR